MPENINTLYKDEVDSVISLIFSAMKIDQNLIKFVHMKSNDYLYFRDSIKYIFDEFENKKNVNYIGVLEWAFCQEIMESEMANFPDSVNEKEVLKRFSNHPNICVLC
jgi:CMP-2-keto-3-deoxyoctulosonic acid synthetase